ncbi:response regulator [Acaryochloris sp. 'Moss Beach']|uniref:response regulator n=1 Tax=Acaryochloris sp. 'Moss Beach' TaxID=2740837 RepID=UPI001F2E2FBB|nr:response regulator [Acaryochloris sp. 'Moss Beach']UJB68020.1 response regulator [Acaryochloris sp. 'Moss Beach']
METTKFDPYQLLTELSSSQASGVLKASNGKSIWHIYLKEGELQYVDCSVQTLAQLSYFLCRQGLEPAFNALKEMPPQQKIDGDSTAIKAQGLIQRSMLWLQEQQMLNEIQARQIIEDITQDALETFLWLRQAKAVWENGVTSPEWVTQVLGATPLMELVDTVRFLKHRMKSWQSCCKDICSPYQRPYLLDFQHISKPVAGGKLSPEALTKLAQLMSRGFSIRQLSVLLKQDELHIAQLFGPYVEQQVIFLRNPQPPFDQLPRVPAIPKIPSVAQAAQAAQDANRTFKIVCIDDSPTILSEIERCLGNTRYEVTTVDDPIQASSVIFRIKPDLILLDITMPKINGYRLCSLLRSSAVFDETPIIMVTGNTGLIDKARAKLAGATDYFTKPFTQKGLMDMVEKYLTQFTPA